MKKIFGLSMPAFLLMVAVVTAGTFAISGMVMANLQFLKVVDYGQFKIGQDTTKVIAKVGSYVTEPLNLTFSCNNPSIITAQLNLPIGSTSPSQVVSLQGSNIINPNITVGDISLAVRSQKQGNFNCTVEVQDNPLLNISFVDAW